MLSYHGRPRNNKQCPSHPLKQSIELCPARQVSWFGFTVFCDLSDLHLKVSLPLPLHYKNKAAIHIAENPVFHERTKHIRLDCHYVREQLQTGFINPIHVKSALQIADVFTKPLGEAQHRFLVSKLGLLSIPPSPA